MASLADNWRECVKRPQDNSAWKNLLNDQRALIARIAVRVGRRFGVTQVDEIDDAVQEVCIKVSGAARQGRIPDQEDLALESYLRALMANAAHDYFRKRRARRRDTLAETPITERSGSQSGPGEATLDSRVLLAQIERFVEGDSREQSIFRLYYQQGWTAKEISALPSIGLSAKGVESVVFRLTAALRRRIADSPKAPDEKGNQWPSAS